MVVVNVKIVSLYDYTGVVRASNDSDSRCSSGEKINGLGEIDFSQSVFNRDQPSREQFIDYRSLSIGVLLICRFIALIYIIL